VRLLTSKMADALIEGRQGDTSAQDEEVEEEAVQ
jgi:hypothetical protein